MTIPENRLSLTKIIATLGPASATPEMIRRLIEAGVSVFRVNFSHGTFESFETSLRLVREVASSLDRHIGVMGDLSGPKVRIGKVVEGGIRVQAGQRVRFVKAASLASPDQPIFSITEPSIIDEVLPGQVMLLDDGNVQMRCVERDGSGDGASLIAVVEVGGLLTSSKGLNVPETDLSLPALTAYDLECLRFAVQLQFDFVSLSFVKNGDDVRLIKNHLRELGARPTRPPGDRLTSTMARDAYGAMSLIPVIAKIEKPQALAALTEIVEEADVIMVARGDLGVEMDIAQVPVIQKHIIHECNNKGKPVIVATQMLQSMIESATPTRAEVTDVANAILDGADAVMLSGETAVGKYPEEAVKMLRRVAWRTHSDLNQRGISMPAKPRASKYRPAALARGVGAVVHDLEAPLVAMWSSYGGGASYLSQLRLPVPVLVFSANPEALRRMSIMYGITPLWMAQPKLTLPFISEVAKRIADCRWAGAGDPIVLVMGQPIGRPGLTNDLRIHYIGDSLED